MTAYIVVYGDVRKIWGGFFDSNYKHACGMLAKNINMDLKIVIFRLEHLDLDAKGKIINMDLKIIPPPPPPPKKKKKKRIIYDLDCISSWESSVVVVVVFFFLFFFFFCFCFFHPEAED